jgi:hypothetical protein
LHGSERSWPLSRHRQVKTQQHESKKEQQRGTKRRERGKEYRPAWEHRLRQGRRRHTTEPRNSANCEEQCPSPVSDHCIRISPSPLYMSDAALPTPSAGTASSPAGAPAGASSSPARTVQAIELQPPKETPRPAHTPDIVSSEEEEQLKWEAQIGMLLAAAGSVAHSGCAHVRSCCFGVTVDLIHHCCYHAVLDAALIFLSFLQQEQRPSYSWSVECWCSRQLTRL